MPVSYSGTAITWPDSSTTTSGWTGFKNRIMNGAMTINQRGFSGSISSTGPTYTLDRWTIYATQTSKLTVSQNAGSVTPPTGYVSYLGVTSSSAYSVISTDVFHLSQYIEGYNTADLMFGTANAATFTLSFWVRSSLTGTFAGCFENVNNDRAYPFTYTISAANTWEQKRITVTGDTTGTWNTTNDRGLSVRWNLGAGTDFNGTVNTWQSGDIRSVAGATSVVGTNGATFYITGVQLERGSTASSFDYRPYGTELALCQRYFYMLANGQPQPTGIAAAISSAYIETTVPFPVTMRSAPTLYSSSGTNYFTFYRANADDFFDSFTIDFASTTSANIYNNTNISSTTGYAGFTCTKNASAYVGFSSEL